MIAMNKNNRNILFCEPCGFKKIIESDIDLAGLIESKTSPIQARLPIIDPAINRVINNWEIDPDKKEAVNKQMKPQIKKYKCPQCGRLVKIRELLKPFSDAFRQVDERKAKIREEEDKKKRIEDGKPPEKKADPNFMG